MPDGTGIGTVDAVVVWSLVFTAVGTALGLMWRILRAVVRVANRLDQFWDDWEGTPARPGVAARPGIVSRVGSLETRVKRLERPGAA